MSEDTEVRTKTLVETLITTPNSYYLVDESLNQNLTDQGTGPYITLDFDVFDDRINGLDPVNKQYLEQGTVIFEIKTTKGQGTRDLSQIIDKIRDAMRDLRSSPGVGEEGLLYYFNLTQQPVFEERRAKSQRPWMVKRVFLNYTKYYT